MPKTKNPDSRSWLNKVAAKRPMKFLNWGLLGYISHRYVEPALSAAEDVVHNNVKVPIRNFFGLNPGSRVKTEADYTEAFLSALDDINISVLL